MDIYIAAACAKTAYCLKYALWCGAKIHLRTPASKDTNTGEAAVLRNMNALRSASTKSHWRFVAMDRFYTRCCIGACLTGTIQTDRSGYAKGIVTKKKIKQANNRKVAIPPQGTIKTS
ncbi:Hypothetical protein PHPALM_4271 [Phytophthora palmivora]|uniref:PiggyBac transposable element-derived protein domain-containing protein n=1 Tax=Phytophthora palmivora TaxID=4796 RepID=A0A2P4YK94_9STRA|nr:Hypothetical protein PHPALM_4271 [Phytophthora palmivora]